MSKTFDKKDIFTLITAEDAKAYIGKEGYFGDSLEELENDIKYDNNAALAEVFPERNSNTVFRPCGFSSSYGLFIPADKVRRVEEKKYRPFETISELITTLIVSYGDTIRFRQKENPDIVQIGMFNGYCEKKDKLDCISIGAWILGVQGLFRSFEFYDSKTREWKPFGVLEE